MRSPALDCYYWQWASLVAFPFVYFGVYLAAIWATKALAKISLTLRRLSLEFACSLIPIALAYSAAHYWVLAVSQGAMMIGFISDPFAFGWNLFGTASFLGSPVILNAAIVWHVQVGLILIGHILGVYSAHIIALRLFGTPQRAMISQIPMLALMLLFTTLGLWILSLPISAGNVLQPAVG